MNVAIVDYGVGNLHSLVRSLEAAGASVAVEQDLGRAAQARALVLPGVGAFGAASSGMGAGAQTVRQALRNGLPCLGICLGMQLLFDSSEEASGDGLGVMAGRVRRVRAPRAPHMGWNDVEPLRDDGLFDGMDSFVAYYANSYVAEPADDAYVIASTSYGVDRFPAAVRRDNIWGVQFHPEKSGAAGRRIISNFVAQARAS